MPCYEVTDGTTEQLVRAKNKASAIAAVTKPRYTAEALTQDQLIDRLTAGAKVIEADPKDDAE